MLKFYSLISERLGGLTQERNCYVGLATDLWWSFAQCAEAGCYCEKKIHCQTLQIQKKNSIKQAILIIEIISICVKAHTKKK